VSIARWNLKEAGGKTLPEGIRTASGTTCMDEFAKQNEVQRLYGYRSVNAVGIWCESYLSYHGRSHGHVETVYEAWSKQVYREKSAEAIVLVSRFA